MNLSKEKFRTDNIYYYENRASKDKNLSKNSNNILNFMVNS